MLNAEAPGYAATALAVNLGTESEPFQLKLQHGKVLKLRVVGPNGNPISKADVYLALPETVVWLGTPESGPVNPPNQKPAPVRIDFHRKTDNDGRVEWDSAPDQDLKFQRRSFRLYAIP